MIGEPGDTIAQVTWITNPFRAEKFAAIWQPAAELVMDFGARGWAFIRSNEDPQQYIQMGLFDHKIDFDRYWFSPVLAEYKVQATGLFHVPVLPIWLTVEGSGSLVSEPLQA
jgi:hypothetical protein